MSHISYIIYPLLWVLKGCYAIVGNYALAIVVFTLLTKALLFPVGMWTQRNSIRMLELTPELNRLKIAYFGDGETVAEETQKLYKRRGYHPMAGLVPLVIQLVLLLGVIGAVRQLLDGTESMLSVYPSQKGGITLLCMPLAAGAAALALGFVQNRFNPLQREQAPASQWSSNGLSIAISLSLAAFVPVGVGLYWICSNLFTIPQQLLLNLAVPAKKYVDYEELEKSRKELAEMNSLSADVSKEDKKREKADYKRFFSVANKHLVFYSEKSGFYKYFQDVIEYLLAHSNVIVHYVTSDPKDQVFEIAKSQPRLRPYYIGEKRLITLMMKMDADMVVMTMPDLDNYHIKRSYVRKDVEYVYIVHYNIGSGNLVLRHGALFHFDTIFCAGPDQMEELREEERVYSLPPRKLVPTGFGLLDRVMADYERLPKEKHEKPHILIAPSWHKDNILDTCIDPLLDSLLCGKYKVIVRPHPEYVKLYTPKLQALMARHKSSADSGELELQTDFSSNETVFQSDLLITDWSTVCYEFSFATKRPTLFIDTPMKVQNPQYQDLKTVPVDIRIRHEIGQSLAPEELDRAEQTVDRMLQEKEAYRDQITQIVERSLYNPGKGGETGAKYILEELKRKKEENHG